MVKNLARIIGFVFVLSCQFSNSFAETLPPFKTDLNVGFYYPSIRTMASRLEFEAAVKLWLEDITQKIQLTPVNVMLFDTPEAMRKAFEQGDIALIVGSPYILAKYFNRADLAACLSGTTPIDKPNGLIMVVRNDKQIASVNDLKGKRLALPMYNELAEVFLDELTLKTYHLPFQKVFSRVDYKVQLNALIYEVFFDRADVAITYQETYDVMVELNPQLQSNITILTNYPFKAPNYGFFHKRYPDYLSKRWVETAIKLQDSPRSKQILNNLKMGGFVDCSVEELHSFDQLIESYTKLKKR